MNDTESHADVVAEMRDIAKSEIIPAFIAYPYQEFADRLTAAHQREMAAKDAAIATPVAWSFSGFIYDDEGRSIGTDEVAVHWGSKRPSEGWEPLYAYAQQHRAVDDALHYATKLATALWWRHYREASPQWEACPDLMGVLTQIDNMVFDLIHPHNNALAGDKP